MELLDNNQIIERKQSLKWSKSLTSKKLQRLQNSEIVTEKHEQTYQEADVSSTGFAGESNDANTQYDHFWRNSE